LRQAYDYWQDQPGTYYVWVRVRAAYAFEREARARTSPQCFSFGLCVCECVRMPARTCVHAGTRHSLTHPLPLLPSRTRRMRRQSRCVWCACASALRRRPAGVRDPSTARSHASLSMRSARHVLSAVCWRGTRAHTYRVARRWLAMSDWHCVAKPSVPLRAPLAGVRAYTHTPRSWRRVGMQVRRCVRAVRRTTQRVACAMCHLALLLPLPAPVHNNHSGRGERTALHR
jgi:hypothetical protein